MLTHKKLQIQYDNIQNLKYDKDITPDIIEDCINKLIVSIKQNTKAKKSEYLNDVRIVLDEKYGQNWQGFSAILQGKDCKSVDQVMAHSIQSTYTNQRSFSFEMDKTHYLFYQTQYQRKFHTGIENNTIIQTENQQYENDKIKNLRRDKYIDDETLQFVIQSVKNHFEPLKEMQSSSTLQKIRSELNENLNYEWQIFVLKNNTGGWAYYLWSDNEDQTSISFNYNVYQHVIIFRTPVERED